MRINIEFSHNQIPYAYAAGAPKADTIKGNPIKSFPFQITDIPQDTKYLAWTLIDYDAIPVCGFAWIHWTLANFKVNQSNVFIEEDISRAKGDFVQGKNSFTSELLPEDFSDIENHYVGPTPPDKDHQYELVVYALKEKIDLENGFYLNKFLNKVNQYKIKQTSVQLIGRKI